MRSFRRKLAGLRPGGFTLVELAVVSAILAGLAVAVVAYVGSTSQTVNTEVAGTVDELRTGVDTSGFGDYGPAALLSYGGPQLTFSRLVTSQTFSPTVANLDSPTFSLSGTLPEGVTFDTATGTFTGPSAWNFQATQIDMTFSSACALLTTGEARCWGAVAGGSSSPVAVADLPSSVASIAVGWSHACARLADGTVRCWGSNGSGQLGNGEVALSSGQVTVRTSSEDANPLSGVASIDAGDSHTCAVLSTGEARCWGQNGSGQLGDGTTTQSTSPVTVRTSSGNANPLSGVASISAGGSHTCVVLSTGEARCWGSNASGRLGDGTTMNSSSPVTVRTSSADANPLSGVASISAGGSHTCVVLSTGEARCWGLNSSGQLGDGTTMNSSSPVTVRTSSGDANPLSGVASVSAASGHTCAALSNGTARCWGNNTNGILGDGGADPTSSSPVTVDTFVVGPDIAAIVASSGSAGGGGSSCALLSNGTIRCWGWNHSGRLGDGGAGAAGDVVTVLGSGPAPAGFPASVTVTASSGSRTATTALSLQ
jgi:prepilin-type N-terminal cleavage/methylation domain-containing protein